MFMKKVLVILKMLIDYLAKNISDIVINILSRKIKLSNDTKTNILLLGK